MDTSIWSWLKLDPTPFRVLRLLLLIGWVAILYKSFLSLYYSIAVGGDWAGKRLALAVAATLLLTCIVWILVRTLRRKPFAALYFLLAILMLGALFRIGWALTVSTVPDSDFKENSEIAMGLTQGEVMDDTARDQGYPCILSLAYRVYPDPISGRVLNLIFSIVAIYVAYRIGKLLFDPLAGLLSALFMAICIPEITMTSVLCTEVGNLCFVVTSFYFFFKTVFKPEDRNAAWYCGLSLGTAVLFRAVSEIYLPVFLLGLILVWYRSRIRLWVNGAILAAGYLVVQLVVVLAFSMAAGGFTMLPLEHPNGALPLLIGTNLQTRGTWEQADDDMYRSWPAAERSRRALAEGARRITSNPSGFLRLVPEKMVILLADNTYGSDWAFPALSAVWTKEQLIDLQRGMEVLAQVTYFLLLLAAILYFLSVPRLIRVAPLVLTTTVVITILPHVLLEVQPRYHHILLGFLAIAGGAGISGILGGHSGEQKVVGSIMPELAGKL